MKVKAFKKTLAMVCAATTMATLTPSVGLLTSSVSTFAATKYAVKAASTSIKAGDSVAIKVTKTKKINKIKVIVKGSAKSGVTVKNGSTDVTGKKR